MYVLTLYICIDVIYICIDVICILTSFSSPSSEHRACYFLKELLAKIPIHISCLSQDTSKYKKCKYHEGKESVKKVNSTLEQATKAQRWNRGIALPFL